MLLLVAKYMARRRQPPSQGWKSALDQHLDGAVGELEQLQYARKRANLVDRLRCRVFVGRVLLGVPRAFGPVITKIPPMDEVLRRHSYRSLLAQAWSAPRGAQH
jgi:hypothetical protein